MKIPVKNHSFCGEYTPREVGVNLKQGYNGDLTSREAGSVGGQMVKKMIESYEKSLYAPLMAKKEVRCGGLPSYFLKT